MTSPFLILQPFLHLDPLVLVVPTVVSVLRQQTRKPPTGCIETNLPYCTQKEREREMEREKEREWENREWKENKGPHKGNNKGHHLLCQRDPSASWPVVAQSSNNSNF